MAVDLIAQGRSSNRPFRFFQKLPRNLAPAFAHYIWPLTASAICLW
jgi:hypothetical protein